MGKGKPKWNSLPSRERFARKVKSWGFSDYIVNRIRESNSKDKTDKSQEDKIMKEFRVTKCLVNSLIGEYAIFADKCKKN